MQLRIKKIDQKIFDLGFLTLLKVLSPTPGVFGAWWTGLASRNRRTGPAKAPPYCS